MTVEPLVLGARLRELRRERLGLTQLELAMKIGTDPNQVSRWERGAVQPQLRTLRRIADFAGVPMAYFFEENGGEPQ